MNSELKELLDKIKEEKLKLEEELHGKQGINGEPDIPSLEDQKQEIINQLVSGKTTRTKKLRKLEKRIKEIKAVSREIDSLMQLDDNKNDLVKLSDKNVQQYEKALIIREITSFLTRSFNKQNQEKINEIAKKLNIEVGNLDLQQAKSDLTNKIIELDYDITRFKNHNVNTKKLEDEKKEKEAILKLIEDYLNNHISETNITADLEKITKSKTSKSEKQELFYKYTKLLEDLEEKLANEIIAKIEKISKKATIKQEKTKINDLWNKYKKTIVGVGGSLIILFGIIATCKSCSNTNKNTNNQPSTDDNETSTTEEAHEIELRNKLVDMGYSAETAASYANIPGFNINYLEYYENTAKKYNIPMSYAIVDYVNRAVEIQKTEFFIEADLNKIIDIIFALDNRTLQTTDNVNLAGYFNDFANDIKIKIKNGTLTETDINKLDALTILARKDSDLGLFLSDFSTLIKNVLTNPNNAEAKNKLYEYIATFALSAGGYSNTDSDIPLDQPYNKNAQVNNEIDWYNAYNSFVNPLSQIYMFIDSENNAYYAIFDIMESTQTSIHENVCGESRKLD